MAVVDRLCHVVDVPRRVCLSRELLIWWRHVALHALEEWPQLLPEVSHLHAIAALRHVLPLACRWQAGGRASQGAHDVELGSRVRQGSPVLDHGSARVMTSDLHVELAPHLRQLPAGDCGLSISDLQAVVVRSGLSSAAARIEANQHVAAVAAHTHGSTRLDREYIARLPLGGAQKSSRGLAVNNTAGKRRRDCSTAHRTWWQVAWAVDRIAQIPCAHAWDT